MVALYRSLSHIIFTLLRKRKTAKSCTCTKIALALLHSQQHFKKKQKKTTNEPPVATPPSSSSLGGKNSSRLQGDISMDTFYRHFYLPFAVGRPSDRAETFRSTNSKNKSVTDRNSWMTFRCCSAQAQLNSDSDNQSISTILLFYCDYMCVKDYRESVNKVRWQMMKRFTRRE